MTGLEIPYLRMYKPHLFDKNLPPKIWVRLMHGIKNLDATRNSHYHVDDWAHDASIVCCETPSRDRQ
jgi:hypothetical protein